MVVRKSRVADSGDRAGDGDGGEFVTIESRAADGGDRCATNSTRYIYASV